MQPRDTYANGRVPSWGRPSDSEDDGGIVVLSLVTDQCDEAESDKLGGHLGGLLTTDDGGEVA